ncbi:MAG: hypothetical protein ACREXX_11205 [Gammaproteobacteria bacterium]
MSKGAVTAFAKRRLRPEQALFTDPLPALNALAERQLHCPEVTPGKQASEWLPWLGAYRHRQSQMFSVGTFHGVCATYLRNNLIIGPGTTGGYYLIGMKRPIDVFTQHQEGRHRYFGKTLAIAETIGCSYYLLEPLWDIDTVEDAPCQLGRESAPLAKNKVTSSDARTPGLSIEGLASDRTAGNPLASLRVWAD